MKRSILTIAAVLATASTAVYAGASEFPQPSFVDGSDLTPVAITGTQTVEGNLLPSSFAGSSGPTGPATVIVNSSAGIGAASGASTDDGSSIAVMNDSFNYPNY